MNQLTTQEFIAICAGFEVKKNSPESSNMVSKTAPKTVPGKLTETIDDGFGLMRDAQTAKPQSFRTGDGWFALNLTQMQ